MPNDEDQIRDTIIDTIPIEHYYLVTYQFTSPYAKEPQHAFMFTAYSPLVLLREWMDGSEEPHSRVSYHLLWYREITDEVKNAPELKRWVLEQMAVVGTDNHEHS